MTLYLHQLLENLVYLRGISSSKKRIEEAHRLFFAEGDHRIEIARLLFMQNKLKKGIGLSQKLLARTRAFDSEKPNKVTLEEFSAFLEELTGISHIATKLGMVERILEGLQGESRKIAIDLICGESTFGMNKSLVSAVPRPEDRVDFVRSVAGEKNYFQVCMEYLQGEKRSSRGIFPHRPVEFMLPFPIESKKETILEEMAEGKPIFVEEKLDGIRIQAHVLDGEVKMFTRNLSEVSEKFPLITQELSTLPNIILDGEIVSGDGSVNTFSDVSSAFHLKKKISEGIQYVCFDILFKEGISLVEKPYIERRKILTELNIVTVDGFLTCDWSLIEREFENLGPLKEGFILKDPLAPYYFKRSSAILKMKKKADGIDVLVMGFIEGKRRNTGTFPSFIAGLLREDNCYEEICRVGTGLSQKALSTLIDTCKPDRGLPFPPNYSIRSPRAIPCHNGVVVEIEGGNLQITSGKISLRFPRFKRFRFDKNSKQTTSYEETVRRCLHN